MGPYARTVKPLAALLVSVLLIGSTVLEEEEARSFKEVYGEEFEVEIQGLEGGAESAICRDFQLTREQVLFFFEHAQLIDGWFMYRAYPWFPCAIRGSISIKGSVLVWEITPAGTGMLTTKGEEPEYVYLVCAKGCEKVFPHGGSVLEETD